MVVWLAPPPGWQPWNIPGTWQVADWDTEVYAGGGIGITPPPNTQVLSANVAMPGFTLKVWIPTIKVRALGGP
jgi:hypothetical protein